MDVPAPIYFDQGAQIAVAEIELSTSANQSRPKKKIQKRGKQECDRGKKTLVLDLDQTLVVASYTSQGDHDFTVDNSPFGVFYMHKRPGLDTFLRTVAQRFEIVVYTAATSDYADEVLDAIDKDCMLGNVTSAGAGQSHCINSESGGTHLLLP
ncbi:hypothetical protein WJX75_000642 [Coccomyxa subellipsoidea]|uniref:Mitochondrial import inner membrane translocase subunit TIM50 n=1 Tax=Coccomyxa subellipsoidea TaxID=248742 RepID=A0ABR2Z089_9CHLO